jgi:hypothetical protein
LICNCAAVQVRYVGQAAARLAELIGSGITDDQLAAAVGALDEATVEVQVNSDGRIVTAVAHPYIQTQIRILSRDAQGRLVLDNHLFRVSQTAPPGTGLRSFARQVAGVRALGIHRIVTYAVGSKQFPQWNGYYTWPRFGYNAELAYEEKLLLQFLPRFRGVRDLNDLILRGGADWWAENGDGREMVFHLDGRRRSVKILLPYLDEKGLLS